MRGRVSKRRAAAIRSAPPAGARDSSSSSFPNSLPYQRLLDELIRSVRADAALLLGADGEVAIQSGTRDERHRLIGAYQGIGLTAARKTLARHDGGRIRYMLCRYASGTIILRPLKDGYYLVLLLPVGGRIAEGIHYSERTQEELNREI